MPKSSSATGHPERAQAPQRLDRGRPGLEHGLGDLQLQRARRQPGGLERARHVLDEVALEELLWRDVDGDAGAVPALRAPGRRGGWRRSAGSSR